MYVTSPPSRHRETASPPLDGPHSGCLIRQSEENEENEAKTTSCWGVHCRKQLFWELPFFQNRQFTVMNHYLEYEDDVLFVPVPGQPPSANRYYVVKAKGSDAGNILTCSRERDRSTTLCGCLIVKDVKPRPFREGDVYQQMEIFPQGGKGIFRAKAVADDGIPPLFLRTQHWTVSSFVPRSLTLAIGPAAGVDRALRERKPAVSFQIAGGTSPAVVEVGRWYIPFFFVKENSSPKEQIKRSVYYEVALEQFWKAILTRQNSSGDEGRRLEVRAMVQTASAFLSGGEPVRQVLPQPDGSVLFRPVKFQSGAVTLSSWLIERMRWEQARGGWIPGNGGVAAVDRKYEYHGSGSWSVFGCYALVERFSLRRMDGSSVLMWDFRHTNKIIVKWE